MNIAIHAEKLNEVKKSTEESEKVKFAKTVQEEIIEPLCKKFDIDFIVHPTYDEFTFLSKETKKDASFEGIWYRPSWGGTSGTMANAKDPEMKQAVEACCKLIASHGLVRGGNKNYVQSFENGLDEKLKDRVIYRLSYFANCP